MSKTDWLNHFVEKNAWGILAFLFLIIVSYTTISNQIQAQDIRISKIEQALLIQSENQREIIVLQQKQQVNEEYIKEIKEDLREIKKALNIL